MNLHDALARLQAVAVPIPITEPHAATQIAATPPAPNLCRYCRETITWRRPGALAFGDHSSAHVLCYEQAEVARILAAAQPAVESPVALTDPAELTLCMPTAEAMLDAQVADKAAQTLGQMAAELVKPPVDRLQGLACAEPSMERWPSYTMFFPSIDCAPATTLGLTCQAERDWPSGMVVHPEREAWRRLLVPIEMAFRMPHVPLAATVAEEIGKAKSSTKLRGPGISLQFTHTDRTVTVVRLWATWMKLRGGAAKLTGFEAQLGRKRSDNRLADFGIREHDGALVYNAQHIFGHLRLEQELAQLAEVVCRMLEAEAAGQAVDLLAVLARNVVAQARSTFCCCCGRLLTDPVSVDSGIGPERGEAFQVAFRRQWQAARETRA